jgi:hypothetical protein
MTGAKSSERSSSKKLITFHGDKCSSFPTPLFPRAFTSRPGKIDQVTVTAADVGKLLRVEVENTSQERNDSW